MTEAAQSVEAQRLYRKAALERISSPEQLDRLVTITRPLDWCALAVLVALLLLALIWGIFGSIPTRVKGSGILVSSGGRLFSALASGDGTLLELRVKSGDQVAKGQVLGRLSQTAAQQTLTDSKAVAAERKQQLVALRGQVEAYRHARQDAIAGRKAALERQRVDVTDRIATIESRLAGEQQLIDKAFITRQKLFETQTELSATRQMLGDLQGQLDQLATTEVNVRNGEERDLRDAEARLAEAERHVGDAELEFDQRQLVLSPTDGRVTEVKAAVGSRVADGSPLVGIESGVTGLQLVLYLPPDHGKEVKPGMAVNIAPSTVRKEEFGTLLGRVAEVSDFPSTQAAMMATLQDERLVQKFSPSGPPFATRIDLLVDPRGGVTGYAWADGTGPAAALSSGTPAVAEIVVRRQSPISLVIPLLRKASGL